MIMKIIQVLGVVHFSEEDLFQKEFFLLFVSRSFDICCAGTHLHICTICAVWYRGREASSQPNLSKAMYYNTTLIHAPWCINTQIYTASQFQWLNMELEVPNTLSTLSTWRYSLSKILLVLAFEPSLLSTHVSNISLTRCQCHFHYFYNRIIISCWAKRQFQRSQRMVSFSSLRLAMIPKTLWFVLSYTSRSKCSWKRTDSLSRTGRCAESLPF